MLAVSLLLALARPTGLACDSIPACVAVRDAVEVVRINQRPAGPETVVLEILDGFRGGLIYSHGVLHVAGCPKCESHYSFSRLRPAP